MRLGIRYFKLYFYFKKIYFIYGYKRLIAATLLIFFLSCCIFFIFFANYSDVPYCLTVKCGVLINDCG